MNIYKKELKLEWLTDLRRLIDLAKKNQDTLGAPYVATSLSSQSTTAFNKSDVPQIGGHHSDDEDEDGEEEDGDDNTTTTHD